MGEALAEYLERIGAIRSDKVIKAFKKIDRKFFVPEEYKDEAYKDVVIPLINKATISQPSVLATMLEALEVEEGMKILEIGTGSGYSTALLSHLVGDNGIVISMEIDEEVHNYARSKIEKLNLKNVKLIRGDGSFGYPREAPYDRIIVHAYVPRIPNPLLWQLKDNGIIVAPVGMPWHQKLVKIRKKGGKLEKEELLDVVFVPLRGNLGEKL